MFYVDQTPIDLALLSPHSPAGGRNYKGDNEIYQKIAYEWQKLVDNHPNPDEPIIFIRPHMKSGAGQGSMGGSYQRTVPVPTRTGMKFVTWCDIARTNPFGQLEFFPKNFVHSPDKSLSLTLRDNIEQILWHVLFDPLRSRRFTYPPTDITGRPHPLAGKDVSCLYILDVDDDARSFILSEAKRADLHYFILSSMSPLANDRDGLNMLASAWGVYKPEQMSEFMVKKELFNAVEYQENIKSSDYGYDAFIQAAKDYTEKGNTYSLEILAMVNQALDRGVVKWYPSRMSMELIGTDGATLKKLCNVPASKSDRYKEVLADYLKHNEDDLTAVKASVEAIPIAQKTPRKYWIPDNPTKDYFTKEMKFSEMQSMALLLGFEIVGSTKNSLGLKLADYFITQGKQLPEEYRATEPK